MAIGSATTAAQLLASSVVLFLSECGTQQTQTFLSIQTSQIESITFLPVIEAIGDHGDGWRGFMKGANASGSQKAMAVLKTLNGG